MVGRALESNLASFLRPIAPVEEGDAHAKLYDPTTLGQPVSALEAMGSQGRQHYRSHGWLAVRGLLSLSQVDMARTAIDDLILGQFPAFDGTDFERDVPGFDVMTTAQRINAVRKLVNFLGHDRRLDGLAALPRLMAIVHHLLDRSNVRMFHHMAMLKPPRVGREKPWHQDHAYFDFPIETRIVGVWIALDHSTIANGCMQAIDGGHRRGPQIHIQDRDWQIPDHHIQGQKSVAFPMQPGDALFYDGLLPHGTPANHTDSRRRSMQFQFCDAAAQQGERDSRRIIFGAEGRGDMC